MKVQIETTDAVIGARVTGVNLEQIPAPELMETIETALEQHGVLIFPDQSITPRQQIDFSRAFADLEMTELESARLPGYEEIFVVGNTGQELVTFAPPEGEVELEWHTDHIHREVPARASMLYALEVPSSGGDTLFACMYSAYDSLSQQQQDEFCTLEIINSSYGLDQYIARQQYKDGTKALTGRHHDKVVRPLVRAHPLTERRALYFGNQVSIGVQGWDETKSVNFIKQLTEHACQEAFQYRHKWNQGDVVLWDNRRVLHAGTPYDTANARRCLHRTTWREDKPITKIR